MTPEIEICHPQSNRLKNYYMPFDKIRNRKREDKI